MALYSFGGNSQYSNEIVSLAGLDVHANYYHMDLSHALSAAVQIRRTLGLLGARHYPMPSPSLLIVF
jgi:hypothetical protein